MYFKKIDDLLAKIPAQREVLKAMDTPASKSRLQSLDDYENHLLDLKRQGKTKTATVKRNGIQVRTVRFVFPWIKTEYLYNWCPLGWMMIAAVLLIIPAVVVRSFVWLFSSLIAGIIGLAQTVDDWYAYTYTPQRYQSTFKKMDPVVLAQWNYWRYHRHEYTMPKCIDNQMLKIEQLINALGNYVKFDVEAEVQQRIKNITIDPEWIESKRRQAKLKEQKEELRRERQRQASKKREVSSAVIVKWTKRLAPIILVPLILAAIFYIVLGIGWVLYWVGYFLKGTFIEWVTAMGKFLVYILPNVLLGLSLLAGVVIGIILFIRGIYLYSQLQVHAPTWACVLGSAIVSIIKVIIVRPSQVLGEWVFSFAGPVVTGIIDFFGFFFQLYRNWKNKECPSILWEEE